MTARQWPLVAEQAVPADEFSAFESACAAVTRDTNGFEEFDRFEDAHWSLRTAGNGASRGWVLTFVVGNDPLFGFGVSDGLEAAEIVVRVAEAFQDHMAGYEFIQWPSHGHRPAKPAVVEGGAVWIDGSEITAAIGSLDPSGMD